MEPRTPRPAERLSRAERRRTIEDAALGVFAARGYQAASVDEIVAAAGISPPVLYDHFASKRELYVAVLEERTDDILTHVAAATEGVRDGEERLRAALHSYFDYVERDPFVHRVLARDESADAEVADAVARCDRRATAAVAGLLAAEPGMLVDDPDRERSLELIAQMLRTGLNGLAAWWRGHPGVSKDLLVERAMDLAWRGLDALRTSPGVRGKGSVRGGSAPARAERRGR